MIFVGDVAVAPGDFFDHQGFPERWKERRLCVNLEGAVSTNGFMPEFGVCNSANWHKSFEQFSLGPVNLANNHIADIPDGVELTGSLLAKQGLQSFGAASSKDLLLCPAICGDFALLGFGWSVIGCVPYSAKRSGTNPLERANVIDQVLRVKITYPSKKIVVVMHWNYEFEVYPQPGHRKLAKELIDMGVYAVIGHHPHIVSPVERYQGKTIAYSVGNWAFSYGRFFGGKLRFPPNSFHQIAIELADGGNIVHHATFSPPTTILYDRSEGVSDDNFSLRPVFEGFRDAEYEDWFRLNRRKKKFLPIYKTAERGVVNLRKDVWVAARQQVINAAVKIGLKSVNRSRD
jgi:hypothetical protein